MSDPREKSGIDWSWFEQLIIQGFKGLGSLIEYWAMPREERKRQQRINGWIANKVERPPEELYGFERDAEKKERLQLRDKKVAEEVVEKFDKLLDDYAAAHPDWKRPAKFDPEWFDALKEAGAYFATENKKLTDEYNEKLAEYNKALEEEQKRLERLEAERRQRAREEYQRLSQNGNKHTPHQHFRYGTSGGSLVPIDLQDHPLLVKLRELESGDNYNAVYDWNEAVNFTDMTISEVIAWQNKREHQYQNSKGEYQPRVVGAYQFKPDTLKRAMDFAGIDGKTKFTPETQHRLAWALAEIRGYSSFINEDLTVEQFTFGTYKKNGKPRKDGIAWEWSVLPVDEGGLSAYASNGKDKAGITWGEWLSVLEECKKVDVANLTIGYPTRKHRALSPVGMRDATDNHKHDPRPHQGTDYAVPKGTPVYAIADGVVATMDYSISSDGVNGYGNIQGLVHYNENQVPVGVTMNAHLNKYAPGIKVGDRVKRGDLIAYTGDTGSPGKFHLHFEAGFFVVDEHGKVQLCMVSYEDMLQFHDRLNDPEVIKHLIDRAVIRQAGDMDGIICSWKQRIKDYFPTGSQLDALPRYNFSDATTRLADEIKTSKGHRTVMFPACTHCPNPLAQDEEKAERTSKKKEEFKSNHSALPRTEMLFGVPITLPGSKSDLMI